MPRAAGDTGGYEFRLYNKANGRYQTEIKIELVSVTTVIKATLVAPGLVHWAHNVTRDNIAGLVCVLQESGLDPREILDLLSDSDWTKEYLTENRLMPMDVRDDAGDRGDSAHAFLDQLAQLSLREDEEAADTLAKRTLDLGRADGFKRATAQWWIDCQPVVLGGEDFVYSLKHGFAGTYDLLWNQAGVVTLTDLKTRRDDLKAYESDHIQTGAYDIAREERTGRFVDRRTALIVHENGKYDEAEADIDRSAFLDLLHCYDKIRGRG